MKFKYNFTVNKSPTANIKDWSKVTKQELEESTRLHCLDIAGALAVIREEISHRNRWHDHTKIDLIDDFHADFVTGFKQTLWWDVHKQMERHHLAWNRVNEDINLVDIIEHVADCVVSCIARSGKENFRMPEISNELLQKAVQNTCTMLINSAEVVE